MYTMVKQNDGRYVMTEIKHYGKGHLDGGHSGRYPWGSGKNPSGKDSWYQKNKHEPIEKVMKRKGPHPTIIDWYEKNKDHLVDPIPVDEWKKHLDEIDKYHITRLSLKDVDDVIAFEEEMHEDAYDLVSTFGFIPDFNNIKKYPAEDQKLMRTLALQYERRYGGIPNWSTIGKEIDKDPHTSNKDKIRQQAMNEAFNIISSVMAMSGDTSFDPSKLKLITHLR